MAYGVKYRAEWQASTRGTRNYVVDILKRDYTGAYSPMYLTGDCATITFGEADQNELQPIKSSEAEITALCTEENNPYMELYTLDPAEYQINIYEDDSLIWCGYLATGDYTQPLAKAPYVVRFRANDGLGVLKALPFLDADGNRLIDNEPVSALIRRLLSPISESVDIWHYNLLYFGQTSPTFDIACIPVNSIYNAFGDEVPTYYDVLEAVLKNFGVQLFQHNGIWRVRSLSTLAAAANSNLVNPVLALDAKSSIYKGIKNDAVLSFLPPLRRMTYPERATGNSVNLGDTMCQPSNWQATSGYNPYKPRLSKYGKALKYVALSHTNNSAIMGTAILPLQAVATRSQCVKLSVSLDIYSDEVEGLPSSYVGVWLASTDSTNTSIVSWEEGSSGLSKIYFSQPTIYWDTKNKKWVTLSTTSDPLYSELGLQKITIDKATTTSARPALSTLPKTSVTFELPELPEVSISGKTYDNWRVVVVVASTGGTRQQMYLDNLVVTIETVEGAEVTSSSAIAISKDGITDEAYASKWRTATEVTQSADIFYPALVDLTVANRRAYGYVEAMSGIADKDLVGKMLYDLRKSTTYTIDGEVDRVLPNGLNSVVTYDGRYYYVNYIKRLLKRGISSIQLRELPQLTEVSGTINLTTATAPREIASLDHSVYSLTNLHVLYRREATSSVNKRIAQATSSTVFTPALRAGVGCVTLAEASSANANKVSAYDDSGRLIAEVVDFTDDILSPLNWVRTAKYDAMAQVWLASDEGRNVVMCDKDGYVIARWECSMPTLSTSITNAEILPYNGGFIYRYYSSYSGITTVEPSYYCYWHSYSIHRAGTWESNTWALRYENIRFVNERYIVYINSSNQYVVRKVLKRDFNAGGLATAISLSAGNEVVAINSALILTRGSNGAAVYDTRNTASSKYYTLGIGTSTSPMVLCGDIVCCRANDIVNTIYSWKRVLPKISSLTSINDIADE